MERDSLADSAALRRRAEAESASRHTHEPKRHSDAEKTRLLQELQVHQIELQMQNEELEAARTLAEAGRTEAEARYAALYEFAPTGYFSFDRNGIIVRTNLAGALLLRRECVSLQGSHFGGYVLEADQRVFSAFLERTFAAQAKQSCELRLRGGAGQQLTVKIEGTVSADRQECSAVVMDITDRKQAEAKIQAALHEKTALLNEVHHRVKNNLQVISSLLRMEARRRDHPATTAALNAMKGRVQSMALLHESLYRSGTFAAVDLGSYLRQVASQSFHAVEARPEFIKLHLDLASVHVEMDQALPCGLLLNELLSNCHKHAFPGDRAGEVSVALHLVDGGPELCLRVSDTGVGLPAVFDRRGATSLGLQLVSDLTAQLGGKLEIKRGPGAVFAVVFKPQEPKTRSSMPPVWA